MTKIDVAQLAALADLAETLPAIQKEVAGIEKSISRLNALLGKTASGKRRGRPKGKPGPKPKGKPGPKPKGKPGPKPKAKKAAAKRKSQKPRVGLTDKVLAAVGDAAVTAAALKKVDGRATAKFLNNMVKKGALKLKGGKFTKA